MTQKELENKIKYAKATALLRELLRQGLIDKELFHRADRLNALSCK